MTNYCPNPCNFAERRKLEIQIVKMDILDNKKEFVRLLKSTNREGVDYVIEDLESEGFFQAPASSTQHLNEEGGLVQHSLNVCKAALMLREQMLLLDPSLQSELKEDSCILASLLHDVCKANIYKLTTRKRKTVIGTWEDYEGYRSSYVDFPMGHGEKSVVMLLLSGLEMSDAEMLAIRWHMGPWDVALTSYEATKNLDVARKKHPLCVLIQCADTLAAGIMERSPKDLEE